MNDIHIEVILLTSWLNESVIKNMNDDYSVCICIWMIMSKVLDELWVYMNGLYHCYIREKRYSIAWYNE